MSQDSNFEVSVTGNFVVLYFLNWSVYYKNTNIAKKYSVGTAEYR